MLSVLVPVPQLLETPGRNNGETSTYITGFKAHPNLFSDYKFSIPISLWILFHAILSSYFTLHTLLPFKHIFLKSFSLKPHIWSFSQAVYAATIFVCVCVCVCMDYNFLSICMSLFFWL